MNRITLPIISKKIVALNTLQVSFGLNGVKFDFQAGQYIRVVLPKLLGTPDASDSGRELSIVSSPNNKKELTVVFRLSGSKFKNAIALAKVGDNVFVEGPYGQMVLPKNFDSIVFVAGGTGIAQFMSMINYATENKLPNKIKLIYANKSNETATYLPALETLLEQNSSFILEKIFGTLTPEILKQYTAQDVGAAFYVSGPGAMSDTVIDTLVSSGVSEQRIHFEDVITRLYPNRVSLSSMIDRSAEGVFITDLHGVIRYVNREWERISGWASEEVVAGKFTPRIIRSGKYGKEFYEDFWTRILNGETFHKDFVNKRRDGNLYSVDEITMPLRNAAGDIFGFITFQRDISERVALQEKMESLVANRTEELNKRIGELNDVRVATFNLLDDLENDRAELSLGKAKDEALLESLGDGVIATDLNGRIILMNKAAQTMFGWHPEAMVGKSLFDTVPVEDEKGKLISREEQPMQRALTTTTTTTTTGPTYHYVRKDKTKFPVAIVASPVMLDNKVVGAVEVFRDISEEQRVDRAKTEFVSLASHQLRTPPTIIKWNTELLKNSKNNLDKREMKMIDEINIANERMIRLVGSLLNVSRLELGTIDIKFQSMNITKIVDEIIFELTSDISVRNIEMKKNYSNNIPDLTGDSDLYSIIFQNLITNAVKYTPSRGRIEVTLSADGQNFLFNVRDNGYGIPKDQQKYVFTKLFRADNVKAIDTDGTGLGLYIAKSVLDLVGGSIRFESEEKKGTTFYVELPIKGVKARGGSTKLVTNNFLRS
ncbi:MAG: PAS domain S-box protein [Candidatus Vogelbacteria bacterium]|nr:PAS domain S-box protein [Candidatus Vogelbacteria bacterium]